MRDFWHWFIKPIAEFLGGLVVVAVLALVWYSVRLVHALFNRKPS